MNKSFIFTMLSLASLSAMFEPVALTDTESSSSEDPVPVALSTFLTMGARVVTKEEDLTEREAYEKVRKTGISGNFKIVPVDGGEKISPSSERKVQGNYNVVKMPNTNPSDLLKPLMLEGELGFFAYRNLIHCEYKGLCWDTPIPEQHMPYLEDFGRFSLSNKNFGLGANPQVEVVKENNTLLDFIYCILFVGNHKHKIKELIGNKERLYTVPAKFLELISFARHGTFQSYGDKVISENIGHKLYEEFLDFIYIHNLIDAQQYFCAHGLISAVDKFKQIFLEHDKKRPPTTPRFDYNGKFSLELTGRYKSGTTQPEDKRRELLLFISTEKGCLDPKDPLTEGDEKILGIWINPALNLPCASLV